MKGSDGWAQVLELAEDQAGLVTRQQVQAAGVAWSTLSRQARGGGLERVAHGVYRVRGGELPDHLELRAAWMQLAPAMPGWQRSPEEGVVSHRSAAALYGLGDLPSDVHEFTVPARRQSRSAEVRLHKLSLDPAVVTWRTGLLVTRPARTVADLLADGVGPEAVAGVVADALRAGAESPQLMAEAVAVRARALGLTGGDGVGLLRWLLDLSGAAEREAWLAEVAG